MQREGYNDGNDGVTEKGRGKKTRENLMIKEKSRKCEGQERLNEEKLSQESHLFIHHHLGNTLELGNMLTVFLMIPHHSDAVCTESNSFKNAAGQF